jgi:capsular polysaccharide biosynthesis protein
MFLKKLTTVKKKKDFKEFLFDFEDRCIYFYRSFLSKYLLARKYIKPVIKFIFIFAHSLINQTNFSSKPIHKRIIKLKDYCVSVRSSVVTIFDKIKVKTFPPEISPSQKAKILVSPHNYYTFPKVYLAQVYNAIIVSETNFVILKDKVICHDLYNFEKDYTREEKTRFHRYIYNKKRSAKIYSKLYHGSAINIPEAATFLDSLSHNYSHWLTEVLPRIASFCSLNKFKNVPIVVDYGLHPNIMESLSLIVEKKRIVYQLKKGVIIKVKKIYLISATGYIPYEPRFKSYLGSHGIFSPDSFNLIRKRVFSLIKKLPAKKYPEKIYLKRQSSFRNLKNLKKIEQTILNKGYVTIETEKFSFLEQVSIFKNAKYIVGVSGAAFANLIFASLNTKITILISEYKYTKYWYWQNIASSVNLKVNYILGKPKPLIKLHPVHSDFTIDHKLIL